MLLYVSNESINRSYYKERCGPRNAAGMGKNIVTKLHIFQVIRH